MPDKPLTVPARLLSAMRRGDRLPSSATPRPAIATPGARTIGSARSRVADISRRALSELLHDATFDRILSSPYVRCMETVVPIAGVRGMPVEPVEELAEAAPLDAAIALVRKHAISGALMCMHGDVLPMLLDYYAAAGVDIPVEREWPKGCVWTLETDNTGKSSARATRRRPGRDSSRHPLPGVDC